MMKKITTLLSLLLSLSIFSTQSHAYEFDYSYAEASYTDINFDFGGLIVDLDGDGFTFDLGLGVTDNIFLAAQLGMYDLNVGVDVDTKNFGVGYHFGVLPTTDLVFMALVGDIEFNNTGAIDTWQVSAGVRHHIENTKLDLEARAAIVDYEGASDKDNLYSIKAMYNVNDDTAVTATLENRDNISSMSIGARYNF